MYEFIQKDGIIYEQKRSDEMCCGCVFFQIETNSCNGSNSASDICSNNNTIWIKKVEEVKEEPKEGPMKDTQTTQALNEGTKYDQEKERYDLIPVLALEEVAKVLTAGAWKYNEDYNEENWRKVPNATRRYYSATMRHIQWVRKGQKHDSETKLHHYAHAISNLMFLLEKELEAQAEKHAEPQMDWDAC